jgi:hypothetical protein
MVIAEGTSTCYSFEGAPHFFLAIMSVAGYYNEHVHVQGVIRAEHI